MTQEERYVVLSSFVDDTEDEYRISISKTGDGFFTLSVNAYWLNKDGTPIFSKTVVMTQAYSAKVLRSKVAHFNRCFQMMLAEAIETFMNESQLLREA